MAFPERPIARARVAEGADWMQMPDAEARDTCMHERKCEREQGKRSGERKRAPNFIVEARE